MSKPVFTSLTFVLISFLCITSSRRAHAIPLSGDSTPFSRFTKGFVVRDQPPTRPEPGAQSTILIGATSDLHGSLLSMCPEPCKKAAGLLHLAPVIEELRESNPEMLLLDAGDTLQGGGFNFYFNYVDAENNQPHPVVKVMNALGYDALTIGNHDFEIPRNVLLQAIGGAAFPWLAANLTPHINRDRHPKIRNSAHPDLYAGQSSFLTETRNTSSSRDDASGNPADTLVFPPYHIVHRNGVRVGILGLTTPGTLLWVDPEQRLDLQFIDMVESARRWKAILRDQERVDVLIGLFHSGGNAKYDGIPALKRGIHTPNASGLIADTVAGFDLIVAGHTHRVFPTRESVSLTQHRTPIVYPGSHAKGISLIRMTLVEQKGRWRLQESRFAFRKAEPTPDFTLLAKLDPGMKQAMAYLEQPTRFRIHNIPDRAQLEACGNRLSHQAVTQKWGIDDLTLFPQRWHRAQYMNREVNTPLRRRHLFKWIRYDNKPVLAGLYGKQLSRLLEPHVKHQSGRRVRSSALLAPGGFVVINDAAGPLTSYSLQNKEGFALGMKSLYRVWMSNYHWNGGSGIASRALLHPTQLIRKEPFIIRDLVFDHLSDPEMTLPEECSVFLK